MTTSESEDQRSAPDSSGALCGRGDFSHEHGETSPSHQKALGATLLEGERCFFRVWAPERERIDVRIIQPDQRTVALVKLADGYHEAVVDDCRAGARYIFLIDDEKQRADPASRYQPDGVHAASEVVAREFDWHDAEWKGVALDDYVIYELHVGTFTPEGTFDAAIAKLDGLRELGITAIELLPIGEFPGNRNWGYDGVYVGAAQSSYGGPLGLKRLVDACHARGIALLLDVVYNHLGPEGNYLSDFAPQYFTDRYRTPWGLALNFDGPGSDFVRWFFIHNALQWIDEFHVDGLRVDAVHAIVDHTAEPFLQDLNSAIHHRARALGREIVMIAETDLNDPRVITPPEKLGLGFDTQWNDDFHHPLHVLLTGERDGYYVAFEGVSDLARVMTQGYLYVGQHSVYRGRKYGLLPETRRGAQFVIFAQNHDQVGNRMLGERLGVLAGPEKARLAAVAVVLSPFLPMLFMGEEYGETAPFQYFTSHSDDALIEAVRKGRLEEFDDFTWNGEPPDPHAESTFAASKLDWSLIDRDEHAALWRFYQDLLRLRREQPALRTLDLASVEATADDARSLLIVRRTHEQGNVTVVLNFSDEPQIATVSDDYAVHLLLHSGVSIDGTQLALPPFGYAVLGNSNA